jgi:acetylornithine deacetylase/succinyl-diaminopimelate desuccinylase-like protein
MLAGGIAMLAVLLPTVAGAAGTGERHERRAREILQELVEINTAPSAGPGQTLRAANLLADRLIAAGFPRDDVRVLGLTPADGNLVARFRSATAARRPILLLAHLDVVEAVAADWATDPFQLVEKEGYFYGRGTRDIKNGAAGLVAGFIRLREEGFTPDRDLILLFTADEETTGANSNWLATGQRALVDAAFALNTDGGYVDLEGDRPEAFVMQTAEKIYASFRLEASSVSGHSSRPTADNAIYELAGALQRLRGHEFPRDLNETTQVYFQRWAAIAPPGLRAGALALGAGRVDDRAVDAIEKSPYLKALIRTTCVATQLAGGHGENVLPEHAEAVVNCRILPQSSAAAVESVLRDLAGGEGVTVKPMRPAVPARPSPLDPEVVTAVAGVAGELWPGVPLLPLMSPTASDGMYFRAAGMPTYGVSAVAEDPDDYSAHAANERIRIRAFNDATEYWYRLMKRLASK